MGKKTPKTSKKHKAPILSQENYIWTPQPGPQTYAYTADWCDELMFGGAKFGGKSDFLLGDYLKDVQEYGRHWQGILIRRSQPELEGMKLRAQGLYPQAGGIWKEQKNQWEFPNGAILRMRSLERPEDFYQYNGHAYPWIGVDEIGQWPTLEGYLLLKGCLRWAEAEIPNKRMRCSANPGGIGHNAVKKYFIDPAPAGMKPIYDEVSKMTRMFIPSRVTDNVKGLASDPGYIDRLKGVGSPQMVKAWLDGDWNIVIGSYFPEFSNHHIIEPFTIPDQWPRILGYDHGTSAPFSAQWWAVVSDENNERNLPKGAIVCYREWYGSDNSGTKVNVGLKMRNEDIAAGILDRQARGEFIDDLVADPSIFKIDGGESIYETFAKGGVRFRRADNTRIPGWGQLRNRLIGVEGTPYIYWFHTCADSIRTIPTVPHDRTKQEDVDTSSEDHCVVGDTLVRVRGEGLIPIRDMVGTTGEVLTLEGWKPFHNCRLTRRNMPLVRVRFEGEQVVCTRDHKFLTHRGWVEAVDLVDECCYVVKLWKLLELMINSKSLMGSCITSAVTTLEKGVTYSIGKCGNIARGSSLAALRFTTSTRIGQTTLSKIWPHCRFLPIEDFTQAPRRPRRGQEGISLWPERLRKSGTALVRGGSGIGSITSKIVPKRCTNRFRGFVSSAVRIMRVGPLREGFAAITANPLGVERKSSMTSRSIVCCVGRVLKQTSINLQKLAPSSVRVSSVECLGVESLKEEGDTYCLTVPGPHHFATTNSNIILLNCSDTCRYVCMSRPFAVDLDTKDEERDPNSIKYGELFNPHTIVHEKRKRI